MAVRTTKPASMGHSEPPDGDPRRPDILGPTNPLRHPEGKTKLIPGNPDPAPHASPAHRSKVLQKISTPRRTVSYLIL